MKDKPSPMERCSRAEYARRKGWSSAYVSKLHAQGRLVLDDRGLVIIANTDVLIDALRHPTRGGDRTGKHAHAAMEAAAAAADDAVTPAPAGAGPVAAPAPKIASAVDLVRHERAERVRKLRIENAEAAGQLVRRDVVEAETFKRARQAQEALMALKDRLAPLLAIEDNEHSIDALLDTEFRHVIATMAGSAAIDAVEEAA